ncbi:MAG: ATP synthase gamma chain [uncultured bacterium (gcode 4)]|uniref:ATP synthase gamma chain n=1 Tax=uncultured bacterium (gcode 4) TaxID=1234023 RepID=K1XW38_9BACT|nr:MAG: ATP synthase gamma chain [uncultured bacterium (gcode 4)]
MELISTVKMKKSQEWVLSSRPFALATLKIFAKIGESLREISVIAGHEGEATNREIMVVISSNKGLCGGYNVNTFKKVAQYRKDHPDVAIDYISVGKKAREFILRTGGNLLADFSDAMKDNIEIQDIRPIASTLRSLFNPREKEMIDEQENVILYDRVNIIYSYYISAINQKSVIKQFLPLNRGDITDFLESIVGQDVSTLATTEESYKIEPNGDTIVNEVIPMVLDMLVYEIFLEAKASEHSARMVAMKNAKDSAVKKVDALTLSYNKARQASITKEVSEIVSGVESMKE